MRGATRALAMLLAVVATGCDAPEGPAFSAQFPPIDVGAAGDINRGPLPVELRDLTGTVVGIATDQQRPEEDFPDPGPGAVRMLDKPNALRVFWLGGICSKVVRMQLHGAEDKFVLTVRDDWDPPIFGGVCPAAGVTRVVIIGFDRPIDASDVAVRMNTED